MAKAGRTLPPAWAGYFTFSKRVPASAERGRSDEEVYKGTMTGPMGWLEAVDIVHAVARRNKRLRVDQASRRIGSTTPRPFANRRPFPHPLG